MQKRIDQIENKLELLSSRKSELENQLANPETYTNPEKSAELNKEYKLIEPEISDLETEWEEKHLDLDELLGSL